MAENLSKISQAIRRLRKDSGMTQVEFAAALKVAPTSIHRWEAGSSSPEFEMVVSLWSLAIECGSPSSREFADFLVTRTDAIQPLFNAKELPQFKALDEEIMSLSVEQRQLVSALVRMLKRNKDELLDKLIQVLLEPWKEVRPRKHDPQHQSVRKPVTPPGEKH